MCGIVGYIGRRQVFPIIIRGLRRLEYRGYDSAGICIQGPKGLDVYKCQGDVNALVSHVGAQPVDGMVGMGHTRWATHGAPSDINAHPHRSQNGHFIVVHNGIIENYAILRRRLKSRGYSFASDTDTEVLANLIEYIFLKGQVSAELAIRLALTKVIGAYALGILADSEPNTLFAARLGSPLVIGVGQSEFFLASDAAPIAEYTSSVIQMNDGEVAILTTNELRLINLRNEPIEPNVQTISWDIEDACLGNFAHYMLKEIHEQPKSILDTFRGRVSKNLPFIRLGGIEEVLPRICRAQRIIIIGCGTSWHAGLVGEYLLEELARIPVEVEYASEFRYRNPIVGPDDVVLAISQSGETADTLAAIKLAREAGALVLGICNVVGSSLVQLTHAGVYTHAGPEIGVASTKAFTTQVAVLAMLSVILGFEKGHLSKTDYQAYINDLLTIPDGINQILQRSVIIQDIAREFFHSTNFLYLGRGLFYPVALEGALKLKEISYIHAEGYPAAEMKHGPIALIDEHMPVVVIAGKDQSHEKVVSNIQEVKARAGRVIAIITEGDDTIRTLADYCIEIPPAGRLIECILASIPLQLLAYHIAVLRGCNVDRPRNLAKSVTVE